MFALNTQKLDLSAIFLDMMNAVHRALPSLTNKPTQVCQKLQQQKGMTMDRQSDKKLGFPNPLEKKEKAEATHVACAPW
uniref:Uncharacterized protein n=1 Tax=Romanomermis culicivorax TaxID=13658 RepID=A0A915JG12_ROMCU